MPAHRFWFRIVHASRLLCLFMLTACEKGPAVEVSEVLNHGLCKTLRTGLTEVSYERLANIRGVQLLSEPRTTPPSPTEPAAPGTFVAISNGSQPTPGYAFELVSARAEGKEIVIDYNWLQPQTDSASAQVVTSPCSVVRITNAANVSAVKARLDGKAFGRLDFPASLP